MIFFICKGEELSKVEHRSHKKKKKKKVEHIIVHPNPTKSVEREVGMVDKNLVVQ